MKIERLDPADLDLRTAAHAAAVTAATLAVEWPTALPPSPEGFLLLAKHGHDNRPHEGLWVVRDDDGTMLGHGSLEVTHWDNPALALVFAQVHPDAWRRGVDALLLDAQIAAARELDRSSLLTFALDDSHGATFLVANGFEIGQHNAQRRLDPRELDVARIGALADEAAEAAHDYELVRLDGPASPDQLSQLTVLFEAINDAPLDDITIEPDVFPVERVRAYDEAMVGRRQHVYRLMARHRRTGDWAGHTILCVDETRPGYGVQEDTSVRQEHRGHRLGMLLKATMLLWMHDEQPGLTAIDTWNAVSNSHMIAVNEALGCRVTALGVALQRTI